MPLWALEEGGVEFDNSIFIFVRGGGYFSLDCGVTLPQNSYKPPQDL